MPFKFIDRTGYAEPPHKAGAPVVISKEAIDAEIARLAALPPPANGRRVSMISNPESGIGNALAPGTAVSLCDSRP